MFMLFVFFWDIYTKILKIKTQLLLWESIFYLPSEKILHIQQTWSVTLLKHSSCKYLNMSIFSLCQVEHILSSFQDCTQVPKHDSQLALTSVVLSWCCILPYLHHSKCMNRWTERISNCTLHSQFHKAMSYLVHRQAGSVMFHLYKRRDTGEAAKGFCGWGGCSQSQRALCKSVGTMHWGDDGSWASAFLFSCSDSTFIALSMFTVQYKH